MNTPSRFRFHRRIGMFAILLQLVFQACTPEGNAEQSNNSRSTKSDAIILLGDTCNRDSLFSDADIGDGDLIVLSPKVTGIGPTAVPSRNISYFEDLDQSLVVLVGYVHRKTGERCLYGLRIPNKIDVTFSKAYLNDNFLKSWDEPKAKLYASMISRCKSVDSRTQKKLFPGGNRSLGLEDGAIVTVDDSNGTCTSAAANNMAAIDIHIRDTTIRLTSIWDKIFLDGALE
jgi:hypothetical protein